MIHSIIDYFVKLLVVQPQGKQDDIDDMLHIIITGERGKVLRILCSKERFYKRIASFCVLLLCIPLSLGATLFVVVNTGVLPFIGKGQGRTEHSIAKNARETKPPQHLAANLEKQTQLQAEIEQLHEQVTALEEEKQEQQRLFEQEREETFARSIGELSKRANKLDKLFQTIGIIVPRHTKIKFDVESHSAMGGPFYAVSPIEREREELISWVDEHFLRLDRVPIGKPANGAISSGFGKRRDPFNGRIAYHNGIDFGGRVGTLIYASAKGVVTKAHYSATYGNLVKIKHDSMYQTVYAHMHKILVKKGDRVKRGDIIGEIGNTGRSTGPHLHYEVLKDGVAIDPKKYVTAKGLIKSHIKNMASTRR